MTQSTIIRAFELPLNVVSHCVCDGKSVPPSEGWKKIRECWGQATTLANWCVHMMTRQDVVRMPGMTWQDVKPMPPDNSPTNLYALAFGRTLVRKPRRDAKNPTPLPLRDAHYFDGPFWLGATQSASAIIQRVYKKYDDERYDVIWRQVRARPSFSYPQPWIVPGGKDSMWTPSIDGQGHPVVTVKLPSGINRKPFVATLVLRGGPEFSRQMAQFREMVAGKLPLKELTIRWQRASDSCHRHTVRVNGVEGRVMVKMVADLPLRERPGDRMLVLLTDPEAFWVADLDCRRAWVLNADHVRRIQARHGEHLCRLQRLNEDAKAERRMSTAPNPRWPLQQIRKWEKLDEETRMAARSNRARKQQAKLEDLCHKDQDRLDSWTHESAAHLVGFAIRQKVGEVVYLDRDTGFIPSFPWHDLHGKLRDKLEMSSIDFYSESSLKLSGEDSVSFDSLEVEADIQPTTPEEDERWTRVCRLREMGTDRLRAAKRRSRQSHPAVSVP